MEVGIGLDKQFLLLPLWFSELKVKWYMNVTWVEWNSPFIDSFLVMSNQQGTKWRKIIYQYQPSCLMSGIHHVNCALRSFILFFVFDLNYAWFHKREPQTWNETRNIAQLRIMKKTITNPMAWLKSRTRMHGKIYWMKICIKWRILEKNFP